MIDLYTWPTPNGMKPLIALEEMGLAYTIHPVNIMENVQKEPDFLKLNPNGRIPAIVDKDNGDFAVFESGAILTYLADKSGKLYGADDKAKSRTMQWLMWQMGGLGPMLGQANVFVTFFPEDVPQAIKRYSDEANRLYGVMDGWLASNEYLGDDYSIADIATWPWVRAYPMAGIDLSSYKNVSRWYDQIAERPAVKAALAAMPGRDPHEIAKAMQEKRRESALA
ncbi:MAG: glutathione S-transferase N-terminal domain-containing protein [Pseudomonadota bacterium]